MSVKHRQAGFTLAELAIVITVIGILAALIGVSYVGVTKRAVDSALVNDLRAAANAFEIAKSDTGKFPSTMPSGLEPSPGVVMQATETNDPKTYCVNAYHTSGAVASWDMAKGGIQQSLCDGVTIGTAVGGSAPLASRGVNIAPDFSKWTLTSGATYDSGTGEITLTGSSYATSPLIRVDEARVYTVGGDFYAPAPSNNFTPDGGYHTGIYYRAADGVTPVASNAGYMNNGCARHIYTLNTWSLNDYQCSYSGGGNPGTYYVMFRFFASNSNYASPNLKVKNPYLKLAD